MPKPWEQQSGEPDLWHHRFHEFYMMAGPERTFDGAFTRYQEAAGKPTSKPHQRRATSHWYEIAGRWKWAERARAFDADERRRVREEHFRLVKETQKRH